MNTLEKLIAKLCPNGVEYKPLGEVFDFYNGYTPSKSNQEYWTGGDIPWFRLEDIRANGRVLADSIQHVTRKAIKGELFPANSLIVSTSATIGEYALVLVPALTNQRFTALSVKPELTNRIDIGFVKHMGYCIGEYCKSNVNQGNFASVDMTAFRKFMFPIPPLSVQQEIVRMLDEMSGLIDALEEELAARKKQYEWYRERLLKMDEKDEGCSLQHEFPEAREVRIGTLIDEGIINMTRGDYITKKDALPGDIPVILGGQEPAYFINRFNHTGRAIVISRSGASAGFVSFWDEPIFITDGFAFDCDERRLNSRYLFHLLKRRQQNLNRMKKGGGVPHITGENLKALDISLPPIAEQNRIVKILDSFDKLCNSITDGLPGEIALRQQQYEYYRDKLLAFKRKETA